MSSPNLKTQPTSGLARMKETLHKGTGWYSLGVALVEIGKVAHKKYEEHNTFTVSVQSTDSVYNLVMEWFVGQVPPRRQHSLRAWVTRDQPDEDACVEVGSGSTEEPPQRVVLSYDSKQSQKVKIGEHSIVVVVDKPNDVGTDKRGKLALEPEVIRFISRSEEARDAVVSFLQKLLDDNRSERKPALWLLSTWGSWRRREDLPLRDLDQVVLARGVREDLVGDLEKFLTSETRYNKRGIPWHRGYLLHGPPGTGKTSIVRGIAKHFGLDLWYAPLGDVDADANLLSIVSEIRPRSILLLEDVDVYHAAQQRKDPKGSATMSGLLNALDGVSTPHGLITIMTTNHLNKLDPAVTRAGRMDRIVKLDLPDDDQATRLFEYFYDQSTIESLPAKGRSPAELLEVFRRFDDDPEGAYLELCHT